MGDGSEDQPRALEAEIARLRSLLEHTSDAIFCFEYVTPIPVDLPLEDQVQRMYDAHLVDCNDRAAEWYGFERREQVLGRHLTELLGRTEVQATIFRAYLAGGYHVRDGINHVPQPDGSTKVFLNQAFGVVEDGLHLRTWGSARDVTETQRLEREVRQAQKLEAVGRLAGGIAHDFNNLLTAMMGALEIAKRSDGERAAQLIDDALATAVRASTLTRRLLTLGRREPQSARALDLAAVVDEIRPALIQLAGRRVRLVTDVQAPRPVVRMDPIEVEQVLANLIVNARDAIQSEGTVRLQITADEDTVRLEVRDDGAGIPEDILPRIFEPFFTTKDADRGSGLGLSTSLRIVKAAGGRIEVSSRPGEETAFTVVLPRSNETPAAVVATKQGPALGGEERVLLVEDEPVVRGIFEHALREAGYDVVAVSNARLARAAFREEPTDVLVTALELPGLDGAELAQQLRVDAPALPVLIVTGHGAAEVERARELGTVVRKPCSPHALLGRIRETLDATR